MNDWQYTEEDEEANTCPDLPSQLSNEEIAMLAEIDNALLKRETIFRLWRYELGRKRSKDTTTFNDS